MDSPYLVDANDLEVPPYPTAGDRGFLSTLPMEQLLTLLLAPTHHAFSLQTWLPKESNRAVVGTFQIPGMAWEYRPQTKSRRRRDINLAPD